MNQQTSMPITGKFPAPSLGSMLPTPPLFAAAQLAQQLRATLMRLHPVACPEFSLLHSLPDADPADLVDVRECAPNVVILPAPAWSGAESRLWVRPEVGERLRRASCALPGDVKIGFWEGFRPLATQQALWNVGLTLLHRWQPKLNGAELEWLLESCVARPDATAEHSTGYALDIALVDESNHVLDLNDVCSQSSRHIFNHALTKAGLTNYKAEWWHWSYHPQRERDAAPISA